MTASRSDALIDSEQARARLTAQHVRVEAELAFACDLLHTITELIDNTPTLRGLAAWKAAHDEAKAFVLLAPHYPLTTVPAREGEARAGTADPTA